MHCSYSRERIKFHGENLSQKVTHHFYYDYKFDSDFKTGGFFLFWTVLFLALKVHGWLFNFGFSVTASLQVDCKGILAVYSACWEKSIFPAITFHCKPPDSVCGAVKKNLKKKKKAENRVMKYSLEIKPSFCYKNNSEIKSGLLIPGDIVVC